MPASIADITENPEFLYLVTKIKEFYCFSIKLQKCTNNAGINPSALVVMLYMPLVLHLEVGIAVCLTRREIYQ